ncbi:MAG: hypothetical protein GY853_15815 [PVC group bacterium]|nr:hypothetical protein [PVC group bacterium]
MPKREDLKEIKMYKKMLLLTSVFIAIVIAFVLGIEIPTVFNVDVPQETTSPGFGIFQIVNYIFVGIIIMLMIAAYVVGRRYRKIKGG